MPYGMSWGAQPGLEEYQFNPIGLNPAAVGIQAGAGLTGAIANWLAGAQDREDQGWGRTKLKSQYGKDVFNPYQVAGAGKLARLRAVSKIANAGNRRLGLNSGQAWEEIIGGFGEMEGDELSQLLLRNALAKSSRDLSIGSQFYGAGR